MAARRHVSVQDCAWLRFFLPFPSAVVAGPAEWLSCGSGPKGVFSVSDLGPSPDCSDSSGGCAVQLQSCLLCLMEINSPGRVPQSFLAFPRCLSFVFFLCLSVAPFSDSIPSFLALPPWFP